MRNMSKWNRESLKVIADKYKVYSEFKKNERGAQQAMVRLGLIDELCAHMDRRFLWTIDTARTEALKYKTRTEFQRGSKGAYMASYRHKWLDEVCDHMDTHVPPTLNEALEVSAGYVSQAAFRRDYPNHYSAIVRSGSIRDLCPHMIIRKLRSIRWTYEDVLIEAKKYDSRVKFKRASAGAYLAALNNGWIDAACEHMGQPLHPWTEGDVIAEAKKHKRRIEFKSANASAYGAALRMNLGDKAFGHMDDKFVWTREMIEEEAKKYKTKTEFRNASGGAYMAAHRKNMIDEICGHMDDGTSGFKPSLPAYVYFLDIKKRGFDVLHKVGITGNRIADRINGLSASEDTKISLVGSLYFDRGKEAKALEKHLHEKYKDYRVDSARTFIGNGFTEIFSVNVWDMENSLA